MWELQVKFYVGQNEACSQGDSTWDTSEKLALKRKKKKKIKKEWVFFFPFLQNSKENSEQA